MNKIMKSIILTTLTMLILFSLTGCNDSEDIQSSEPVNIAFVMGIADDETKINYGIRELAMLPAKPGTHYAFISVEGETTTIGEPGIIPDLSDRGYTDVMMERVSEGIWADLTGRLTSYEPSSSQIDLASGTEQAVRILKANSVEGRKNLLVYYCGGKSTTGLINMIETPVYKMDVEASVATVAQKMNVDMTDIDVVWYCCGDFGPDQPQLSTDEKKRLKSFYQQLFQALGAKSVTFRDDLPSSESYEFSTSVSCMAVKGIENELEDCIVFSPDIFDEADVTVLEAPIVIPEDQVQYKPNSADFLYPESAAAAIQPIAELLAEHSELEILLYGTCAGDVDTENTLRLGKERAERVKQELVAAGIDEQRITAVTVKVADDPYYQFGLGTGSEASVNRKTVLIDMSTEFAREILENAI